MYYCKVKDMCVSAGCKILHLIKEKGRKKWIKYLLLRKRKAVLAYWFLNLVSNILTIVDVHLKSYI